MIAITVDTGGAEAKIARLQAGLTPEAIDPIVDEVAFKTLAQVVAATPKHWFGQVRAAWQVMPKTVAGARFIRNDNKIMHFLEYGTRDHGPVTAKMLWIPLRREAALAPRLPGSRIRQPTSPRRNRGGWSTTKLVWGVDFILKKWVRGIAARGIVRAQVIETEKMLSDAMVGHVKGLVNG